MIKTTKTLNNIKKTQKYVNNNQCKGLRISV